MNLQREALTLAACSAILVAGVAAPSVAQAAPHAGIASSSQSLLNLEPDDCKKDAKDYGKDKKRKHC